LALIGSRGVVVIVGPKSPMSFGSRRNQVGEPGRTPSVDSTATSRLMLLVLVCPMVLAS